MFNSLFTIFALAICVISSKVDSDVKDLSAGKREISSVKDNATLQQKLKNATNSTHPDPFDRTVVVTETVCVTYCRDWLFRRYCCQTYHYYPGYTIAGSLVLLILISVCCCVYCCCYSSLMRSQEPCFVQQQPMYAAPAPVYGYQQQPALLDLLLCRDSRGRCSDFSAAKSSRYNKRKSHSGDQRGSGQRLSTSTDDGRYPTYPRGKSSKITYNYELWRAHRPEELKGVSPSTGIVYYLIFSLYILLFCLLVYYHISVPSRETKPPSSSTKLDEKEKLMTMLDVVRTAEHVCNTRKLVSGHEYIGPGVAEKVASVRPQCYQDCNKYDTWFTEHVEMNKRYKRSKEREAKKGLNHEENSMEYVQFDNDAHFRLYYPREVEEAKFIVEPVKRMQECLTSYDVDGDSTEVLPVFFICFIAAIKHTYDRQQNSAALHAFNPSREHYSKCAIGASYRYWERANLISPNPEDYLIVCADINKGKEPLVGLPFVLFDDRLGTPLALAIAPNGNLRNYQAITLQLAAYYCERTRGMERMELIRAINAFGRPVYLVDKPDQFLIEKTPDSDHFEGAWEHIDRLVKRHFANRTTLGTAFREAVETVHGLKRAMLSQVADVPYSPAVLGLLPDIGGIDGFQTNGITVGN